MPAEKRTETGTIKEASFLAKHQDLQGEKVLLPPTAPGGNPGAKEMARLLSSTRVQQG